MRYTTVALALLAAVGPAVSAPVPIRAVSSAAPSTVNSAALSATGMPLPSMYGGRTPNAPTTRRREPAGSAELHSRGGKMEQVEHIATGLDLLDTVSEGGNWVWNELHGEEAAAAQSAAGSAAGVTRRDEPIKSFKFANLIHTFHSRGQIDHLVEMFVRSLDSEARSIDDLN
ncbi:hypothetical protein BC835DRAFT_1411107 [Cytidiella melzeri]|nr:hypothetical protein BC835DRAFT_1411107 [Cytidiella melzeri]